MANLHMQRRRGNGRERGATLVEFALICPLLFMLLLGTLTGGLTLSRQNSVENAVREGTRFGAVTLFTPATVDTYLANVIAQTRDAATGDLAAGVDSQYICASVVYQTTATPPANLTRRIRQVRGVSQTPENAACFTDSRPAGEKRVQVAASRRSDIEGILFTLKPTLDSRSVTRYER